MTQKTRIQTRVAKPDEQRSGTLRYALAQGALLDRYRIETVLGKPGGFGVTYLAVHSEMPDKWVAIKEYLPVDLAYRGDNSQVAPHSEHEFADYDWGLERFLDEARHLSKFEHSNIVRVSDFFRANGTAYLVMDYSPGETLAAFLEREGAVRDEQLLLSLFMPVLDGLKTLHNQALYHRDIKPENIYLREGDQPMLIDFGAARQVLGGKTKSLSVVLSEGYAPREQYSSVGELGPWTDIYAVGACFYRAITGKKPASALDRIESKEQGSVDPLSDLDALYEKDLSQNLRSAILKGLALNGKDRPQSVDEFQQLLLGNQPRADLPPPQNNPHTADVSAPKSQRNGLKAVGITALLVALGGAGFYVFQEYQKQTQAETLLARFSEQLKENDFDLAENTLVQAENLGVLSESQINSAREDIRQAEQQANSNVQVPPPEVDESVVAQEGTNGSERTSLESERLESPSESTAGVSQASLEIERQNKDKEQRLTQANQLLTEFEQHLQSQSFSAAAAALEQVQALAVLPSEKIQSAKQRLELAQQAADEKNRKAQAAQFFALFEARLNQGDLNGAESALASAAGFNVLPLEAVIAAQQQLAQAQQNAHLGNQYLAQFETLLAQGDVEGAQAALLKARILEVLGEGQLQAAQEKLVSKQQQLNAQQSEKAERYLAEFNALISKGDVDGAQSILLKGQVLGALNPVQLNDAKKRLESAQQLHAEASAYNNLNNRFEAQLKGYRLKTPRGNNAWESWEEAKQLYLDSELAQVGGGRIAERYMDLAERKMATGDWDKARGYIKSALGTGEANPQRVSSLQTKIQQSAIDVPQMLNIQGGRFQMGDLSGAGDRDEQPVRWVQMKPFRLSKFEVTFAQYDVYVEQTGAKKPSDEGWGRGHRPVINVSHQDAKGYIRWLNAATGRRFRLPSEAEWEYAARAGSATQYAWGGAIGEGRANCDGCSNRQSFEQTTVVGRFAPNAWGLYDMHGNVWEWVEDRYHPSYNGAPSDGRAWSSGGDASRVLRGGSWTNGPDSLRVSFRNWIQANNRDVNFGFRLAEDR